MLTMSVDLDPILLQGLRSREEGAVARFLDLYWERAYRVALQLTPDSSAAEDVAQETFIAVLEGLSALRDEGRFRSWFFSVLSKTATKHHRSRTRRSAHEARGQTRDQTREEARDPMKLAQDQEQAALVRAQIQELSPKLRHALALRYLEGLSLNEVAQALDVPRKTVSSRIRLGLEALKTSLEPALGVGAALSLATLPVWIEGALRVPAPPAPSAQAMLAKLSAAAPAAPAAAVAEPLRAGLALGVFGLVALAALSVVLGAQLLGSPGAGLAGASPRPQPPRVAAAASPEPQTPAGREPAPAPAPGQEAEPEAPGEGGPAEEKGSAPVLPASPPPAEVPQEARPQAEIAGRVLDPAGRPIPFARVVVATPARDMRDLVGTEELAKAETDAGGYFRLSTPIEGEEALATIEVYAKGFGTLMGESMGQITQDPKPQGPSSRKIGRVQLASNMILTLTPGGRSKVEIRLEATAYVGGRVVDGKGAPVPGVRVTAIERQGSSYGYVSQRVTDAEGRFEVFDYSLADEESGTAELVFEHPQRQRVVVKDAYALDEVTRGALEVVVPLGLAVSGRALDAEGAPLAGVLVSVEAAEVEFWRACRTDAAGEFKLEGLPAGAAKLRLLDLEGERKAVRSLVFVGDISLGGLALEKLQLPRVEVRELLGMKLVTLTPELREAYELSPKRGVLVLDPGPEQARLGLGLLEKGDVFWKTGMRRIATVEEFAEGILEGKILEGKDSQRLRVVYSFRRPGESSWMSMTTSMKLSAADLAGAKEFLGR